jgi:hypothetical protein
MLTAEEAKSKVENIEALSESDFRLVQERTERAINAGQRRTSVSYGRNDKRYWPMKRYLESLGYETFGKNNAYGCNLNWSW